MAQLVQEAAHPLETVDQEVIQQEEESRQEEDRREAIHRVAIRDNLHHLHRELHRNSHEEQVNPGKPWLFPTPSGWRRRLQNKLIHVLNGLQKHLLWKLLCNGL